MDRRRLLFYILLNIFVSASVTLTILWWHDRNMEATLPPMAAPVSSSGTTAVSVPTAQQGTVKIISVVGAGMLSVETVTIQYKGNGELDLTGWQLKDSKRQRFYFPAVQVVHERRGAGAYCSRHEYRS